MTYSAPGEDGKTEVRGASSGGTTAPGRPAPTNRAQRRASRKKRR